MNICQNCGQSNSQESNFCRFCGTRFQQMQQQNNYEIQTPQPYAWKTDEFKIENGRKYQPNPRSTTHLNNNFPQNLQQHFPPPQPAPLMQTPFSTTPNTSLEPMPHYHQPPMPVQAYRCPRCFSQYPPRFERKISTAGWIVFAALLIAFFPLFWIGFLIKEDVRICPMCNLRVS